MPLNPGDLLFVGWDSDNDDISFVATTDIAAGEVIYFTDDEWDGSAFLGTEQLIEWTVPAGGLTAGTVVNIDMDPGADTISFDSGGTIDYIRGGYDIAGRNEMFWAFQGTRNGNTVTPTDFVAVIANEAQGSNIQTPNLTGTGLTTANGAIIIDGDEDYMEWTADGALADPVVRDDLIASILDTDNWTTADGGGNSNPRGTGFDVDVPSVVCFANGTLIETSDGPQMIDTLWVGQQVKLLCGRVVPIRWIGQRHIRASELARSPKLRPVRISAGALGLGLPHRDLVVSRQHRVLVTSRIAQRMSGQDSVWVPAIALTEMPGIAVDEGLATLTYYHILCDDHEVLVAEGAPAESLYLGPEAVKALSASGRAEIAAIFPDIFDQAPFHDAGFIMMSGRQQRKLVQRHVKNDKPLLELLDC
ncbi:Hint domain-containing protein [Cognatiyoonia sp. IB215182]|uniref:Hint domain-containing protein n=1 Tax=Cognatiyoonia sp. IB215182 TaxID=3097353 RepID=UPI002A0B9C4F|nr:Hint domain-containing protein [Cognatiyoonia sp. IB215182]MDX8354163.1 Hint domain-containing protein [Cognatiyoonia sp. IB215182]